MSDILSNKNYYNFLKKEKLLDFELSSAELAFVLQDENSKLLKELYEDQALFEKLKDLFKKNINNLETP